MKSKSLFCLGILFFVATTALLLAAGCNSPGSKPARATPVAELLTENQYVGNEACSECHKNEYITHKNSYHATTARLVPDLGKIVLPPGDLFGSKCRLNRSGRSFTVTVGGSPIGAETLEYGLGSDKAGITFVTLTDKTALFEMRASYFPGIRQWYKTPGQRHMDVDEMGLDFPPDRARQCMGCHTTTLPADSIIPESKFLGVGCEACHGPGGAHVAAVKAKDFANIRMDRLGTYGAEKLNTLCGRCHRTERDVLERSPGLASETQRFQSYGIMKSRCYKEGKDKLSCLTCHDPHANATLNMRTYEKACLNCHDDTSGSMNPASKNIAKSCPVNPHTGCIPCHMPARKIIPDADRSPSASDHFIHIPAKGSHPSPYRTL